LWTPLTKLRAREHAGELQPNYFKLISALSLLRFDPAQFEVEICADRGSHLATKVAD